MNESWVREHKGAERINLNTPSTAFMNGSRVMESLPSTSPPTASAVRVRADCVRIRVEQHDV